MGLSVIIAPDSFKGSLPAAAAAETIAAGWLDVRASDNLALLPQADGGEGTLDAIEAANPDAQRHLATGITGPDGRPTTATWLELADGVAVVELAESSGLGLMARPDPLGATTRGLGQVIRLALSSGATSLVIALGGSASTDGAAGALQALGLRLLQADGSAVPAGGGGLSRLHRVDARGLVPPPTGGVTLLTDVTAPLVGESGAATVFGPQKGATPNQVRHLEGALTRYASVLGAAMLDSDRHAGSAGAGAAGGAAFGFATAWGARIEPGAPWIARATGLTAAIGAADAVITGEGRLDATSFTGKVVGNILGLVGDKRAGVIAGSVTADAGDAWVVSLEGLAGSAEAAMAEPERWLRVAGRNAARHFGTPQP